MKFENTALSQCKYGDIAAQIWADWDILHEDVQGTIFCILAKKECQFYIGRWCDEWAADCDSEEGVMRRMLEGQWHFYGLEDMKNLLNCFRRPRPHRTGTKVSLEAARPFFNSLNSILSVLNLETLPSLEIFIQNFAIAEG